MIIMIHHVLAFHENRDTNQKSILLKSTHDKMLMKKTSYLRKQFAEVFKHIGAVEVAIIIKIKLSDEAGDVPELNDRFD